MVFLRHTGESLDILVTDLDIGKTGVLAGKLFKTLPAAVDFGLLAFLDFLQELFDGFSKTCSLSLAPSTMSVTAPRVTSSCI